MQKNYSIIQDEAALIDFIDWLPNLLPNEIYYLCLFARRKYCLEVRGIRSDKSQLKRFTSTKDRMLEKIRQLECPVGSYRNYGIAIPQESLALYITPSPRDMQKATINAMVDLAHKVRDNHVECNPHQITMSSLQRTRGTKHVITFDVDTKDTAILHELQGAAGDALTVIETRGGYHFIVRPELMPKDSGNWHKTFSKYCDQSGDILCPVVGATQGGHIPKFICKSAPFDKL